MKRDSFTRCPQKCSPGRKKWLPGKARSASMGTGNGGGPPPERKGSLGCYHRGGEAIRPTHLPSDGTAHTRGAQNNRQRKKHTEGAHGRGTGRRCTKRAPKCGIAQPRAAPTAWEPVSTAASPSARRRSRSEKMWPYARLVSRYRTLWEVNPFTSGIRLTT